MEKTLGTREYFSMRIPEGMVVRVRPSEAMCRDELIAVCSEQRQAAKLAFRP
jgi:hypothetical protein